MAAGVLIIVGLCVGVCIVVPISSEDPLCGMKLRITTAGLNYANKVLIDNLKKKTEENKIDDLIHNAHHLSFQLTGIHVLRLSVPSSSVTLMKDEGLQWSARDVEISVSADYHYEYEKKILIPIKISGHGSVDITVRGASFAVQIGMGVDKTNRPSIHTTSVYCHIDDVKAHFSGGLDAMILNLVIGLVQDYLKNVLKDNLCDLLDKSVNHDTEKSMQRLKISSHIGKHFVLDYGLLIAPVFHTDSVETFHKGIIYVMNKNETVPFHPSPFPPITTNNKMLYAWISGYMFNSLTYHAQMQGMLKRTLTNNDFGENAFLNISCKFGAMCIGKFLPQLREHFPNQYVEIEMVSTKAPDIALINGELHLIMNGKMTLYVRPTSTTERHYLFTMDVDLMSAIKVSYAAGYLHSKLGEMSFSVCIWNSTVHPLYERALNFIMQNVVKQYIQPVLEGQGAKGLPLIITDDVRLVNTDIQLTQDAIMIETDVEIVEV
ncbi:lipopolysaccharide-binding protein-like [Ylistrum balloti]|uniref:lipopolysaccharide-binding protein-like n=1 Tax=Ylistrum balloti TaxID=509963 RepID=UPI002905C729|nr:lipopolysaccharide-binding protein-like [Ylistrum balloti]